LYSGIFSTIICIVQGELDFSCRIESGFQDLGQHFHVVDGRIPLGKHGPEPIGVKSTKESLPLLAFLFDPVIEVAGLQFLRAPGQIGITAPAGGWTTAAEPWGPPSICLPATHIWVRLSNSIS
jgi:hypothetical protein